MLPCPKKERLSDCGWQYSGSKRLAAAQQTVKYQLTLIGASSSHYLYVNVAPNTHQGLNIADTDVSCCVFLWAGARVMTRRDLPQER